MGILFKGESVDSSLGLIIHSDPLAPSTFPSRSPSHNLLPFNRQQNIYTPAPHPPSSHPQPSQLVNPPRQPPLPNLLSIMRLRRPPILRPHKIRESFRFLIPSVSVSMTVIIVSVRVVGGSDVFHAVDAAAFGAAFDGAGTGNLEMGC